MHTHPLNQTKDETLYEVSPEFNYKLCEQTAKALPGLSQSGCAGLPKEPLLFVCVLRTNTLN